MVDVVNNAVMMAISPASRKCDFASFRFWQIASWYAKSVNPAMAKAFIHASTMTKKDRFILYLNKSQR
jgi:hypothetical protein